MRVLDDPHLLESGKSYLFVTRLYNSRGWHTVVSGYGNLLVDVSDNAEPSEVLESDSANALRKRFQDAIEGQTVYDPSSS